MTEEKICPDCDEPLVYPHTCWGRGRTFAVVVEDPAIEVEAKIAAQKNSPPKKRGRQPVKNKLSTLQIQRRYRNKHRNKYNLYQKNLMQKRRAKEKAEREKADDPK